MHSGDFNIVSQPLVKDLCERPFRLMGGQPFIGTWIERGARAMDAHSDIKKNNYFTPMLCAKEGIGIERP